MSSCPKLLPVSMLFRCADGQAIAYATPFTELFYSLDGQSFFEVMTHSFNGFDQEHYLQFRLPDQGGFDHDRCLHRRGDLVTVTDHPFIVHMQLDFVRDHDTTEIWVDRMLTDETVG